MLTERLHKRPRIRAVEDAEEERVDGRQGRPSAGSLGRLLGRYRELYQVRKESRKADSKLMGNLQ